MSEFKYTPIDEIPNRNGARRKELYDEIVNGALSAGENYAFTVTELDKKRFNAIAIAIEGRSKREGLGLHVIRRFPEIYILKP